MVSGRAYKFTLCLTSKDMDTFKEALMAVESHKLTDGEKPRTREELEQLLESPEFRKEMMDGFDEIARGNYVSYSIDEIKRRLRFDG